MGISDRSLDLTFFPEAQFGSETLPVSTGVGGDISCGKCKVRDLYNKKMKLLILSALLASACAFPQRNNDYDHHQQQQQHQQQHQPQHQPQHQQNFEKRNQETTTWIPILKYNKEQGEDGSYKTEYQTGNNIVHEESGYLKDFSDAHPNGVLVQQGAYSYEAPDGQIIHVQYTADEKGFRVTGDHLPTEPPIPEGIRKGLEEIYAGIKRREQEAKSNPKYAETAAQRAELDYNGQYYHQ
ncbi:endocuticle structural glycoprotein SgAbd-2 [Aedes albopictus]|uniref:Uncharacterized protein n=1 Tax=Aedes albopictus TaxID=7160 RepID=A0ABM2A589_AEDAL